MGFEIMNTERLILRQWKDSDLVPYSKINADPEVMRFFPTVLSDEESNSQALRGRGLIDKNGWGFWAVELKSTGQFIGFVGLHRQDCESGIPNAPLLEIGWRLSANSWGNGFAPEAARSALRFAFEELDEPEIYSFTVISNLPSKRVMQKIGMSDTGQDFNHPKLPNGHRLERHCLYKITKQQWLDARYN
jgi:RimJ/RimL family protein N-acetyltransferase